MDNIRTEETQCGAAFELPKKAYKTPAKMVVLGGIDVTVLGGGNKGSELGYGGSVSAS